MRLNIGDVVELQFEGSNLSGVVTAVTPERVELAFTYNLFVEGPAVLTWGDGTQQPLKIGLDNGITKIHLRLPLEEVARAQAAAMAGSAGPTPVPEAALVPEPAWVPEPAPEPEILAEPPPAVEPQPVARILDPDADMFSGASLDSEALSASPVPQAVAAPAAAVRPQNPSGVFSKAEQYIQRPGIWVDYESRVDGFDPQSGSSFMGTTTKVCVAGLVLRVESGTVRKGTRVQILFGLERDTFDIPAIVVGQEGSDLFAIQFDEPEARSRLLKMVLALSKDGMKPQRGWR